MDSAHSETRPSNYDSGDEWEIGLGNLIIDLDADLEKDKQDGTTSAKSRDSSPLRIGKMKIKRKVNNSAKGDTPSMDPIETACSSSESVPTQAEQDVTQPGPKRVTPTKSSAVKRALVGVGADAPRGELTPDKKKLNLLVEGATAKTLSCDSCIPAESKETKEVNSLKASKSGEKSNEDGKKKEGSKRSSDGPRKPSGKRPKYDKTNCSVGVDTMDMGTITEPESLGPCEPGTSVTLEGIVWHENDQGVLVVNVTWRNKTYVGTLLDCTQHNWAPPRFCDSPVSDPESRQTKSSSRAKRGRSSSNHSQEKYTETRSSMHSKLRNSTMAKGRRTSNSSSTGRKTPPTSSERISNSGKRKVKSSDTDVAEEDDLLPSAKRTKSSHHKSSNSDTHRERTSDGLISCPEPNCSKKYKHMNGLRYHKVHAHHKPESASPSKDKGGKDKSEGVHAFKKPREEPPGKEKKLQQPEKMEEGKNNIPKLIEDNSGSSAMVNQSLAPVPEEEARKPTEEDSASMDMDPTASQSNSSSKIVPQTVSRGSPVEGVSPRKGGSSPTSAGADLSVFDFNPSLEEPEPGSSARSRLHSPEKITSPTQRPCLQNPDCTVGKPEAPTMTNAGEKMTGKDPENSPDKRSDKERSKEKQKRKEKSVPKPPKLTATRPIAPAPSVSHPQQLIAIPIPATIVKPGTMASTQATTVTVTAMPAVTTKMTSPIVGSNLKPIQPKPTIMGEPSTVNPSLASLKDRKQKMKKKKEKKEISKDRKERRPEKLSGDRTEVPLRTKAGFVPPMGEMNILKQALTSTVSPMEMLNTSLANLVTPSAGSVPLLSLPQVKPTTLEMPQQPVLSQPSIKPPGMGLLPNSSSAAVLEIPKLISLSQDVSSALPPYSIPSAGHRLSEERTGNVAISTSVITRTVQSSLASIPSVPAIEALSLVTDAPRSTGVPDLKSAAPAETMADTSRKTSSPAYSDISDEGGDNHSIVFHDPKDNAGIQPGVSAVNEHHLKMSSLSLLRGSPETLKHNVTLPLPIRTHSSSKESKPDSNPGMERAGRGEDVSVPQRIPHSEHYTNAAASPYFPVDSRHPTLQGLHKDQSPVTQKPFNTKSIVPQQQQQTAKAQGENLPRTEPSSKTAVDPMDPNINSIRIHLEHVPPPPNHRTETELHKAVPPVHDKNPSSERTTSGTSLVGSSSLNDRREKEGREVKQQSVGRERDPSSHIKDMREEKREHSSGSRAGPRHVDHHGNNIEGDKCPSSRSGQRNKPSRSVSPAYRNSEWSEKNRYSSSPSRSRAGERTTQQLPASQNGVPVYTSSAGFLHNPYMPYGALAYDPSHPAFNQSHSPFSPMVAYPTLLPGDVPYSSAPQHWPGSSDVRERSGGRSKESPASSSASLSMPSTSRTSEAHERPTKALDMFAHGNDSYSRHRPRSGSPERAPRPSSSSTPKGSSPIGGGTMSPPRTAGAVPMDPRMEMARRQEAAFLLQQQMLHQHLHTHQHTHLGMAAMGYPAMVPPYDPYVLAANHQAAAGVNPFAVRRE